MISDQHVSATKYQIIRIMKCVNQLGNGDQCGQMRMGMIMRKQNELITPHAVCLQPIFLLKTCCWHLLFAWFARACVCVWEREHAWAKFPHNNPSNARACVICFSNHICAVLFSFSDNRAGPSNLGNVISQILLCKQITPDFNQEELCSITKDSQELAKLLSDMQEYIPNQETYLGNELEINVFASLLMKKILLRFLFLNPIRFI